MFSVSYVESDVQLMAGDPPLFNWAENFSGISLKHKLVIQLSKFTTHTYTHTYTQIHTRTYAYRKDFAYALTSQNIMNNCLIRSCYSCVLERLRILVEQFKQNNSLEHFEPQLNKA